MQLLSVEIIHVFRQLLAYSHIKQMHKILVIKTLKTFKTSWKYALSFKIWNTGDMDMSAANNDDKWWWWYWHDNTRESTMLCRGVAVSSHFLCRALAPDGHVTKRGDYRSTQLGSTTTAPSRPQDMRLSCRRRAKLGEILGIHRMGIVGLTAKMGMIYWLDGFSVSTVAVVRVY